MQKCTVECCKDSSMRFVDCCKAPYAENQCHSSVAAAGSSSSAAYLCFEDTDVNDFCSLDCKLAHGYEGSSCYRCCASSGYETCDYWVGMWGKFEFFQMSSFDCPCPLYSCSVFPALTGLLLRLSFCGCGSVYPSNG